MATTTDTDSLLGMITEAYTDYQRHLAAAETHLRDVTDPITPGQVDEDGEPYPDDPLSPGEHQTAAATHAALAQAAATALAALTTLRTSRPAPAAR
ncbi:hypothetical protein Ga0074812_14853 [Parafrankia irregularis]|uniref:Uncharacterized protein n=1 Tax=Parafrankia irregularis TaxID=795642 RepID=A0A0S4QZ32_9ACTN|nr:MULTISPECIES: hypothetical protein [Parafrankia]MBE3206777.1 hypothetical protein [Parafrankia sp. CH37]CUU60853.1 hypothetical protein Ga0074812_14853 [Parafrankia irregularis]